MSPRIGRQQALRPGFALALIVGLIIFLYWDSIAHIWSQWTAGLYGQGAHGLPLLAILSFLVYRRWRTAAPVADAAPRPGAVGALALLSLLWALGRLGDVQILQDLAFYFMVFPFFWILYGYRQGSMLSWPLILLITAFPIWDSLSTLHREITTAVSVRILNGFGISALREGFLISVPAGDFFVDEGCSGIAQFTSALAVTGLYAYLERLSLLGSSILMALGWLVAITANLVRVVIIIVAGQVTAMQTSLVRDHGWLGWVVFGIGITALLWIVGRRLPQTEAMSHGLFVAREARSAKRVDQLTTNRTVLIATLFAVAIGPIVSFAALSSNHPTFRAVPVPLPERVGPWLCSAHAEVSWHPELVGADAERQALYREAAGGEVDVYVATYAEQRQGKEAVFDLNRVYDGVHWRDAQNPHQYPLGGELMPRQVEETLLQGTGGGKRLVWRWYLIGKQAYSGRLEAKLASVAAALRGDRSARVVILSAPVQESLDATRDQLREFVSKLKNEQ